MHPVLNRVAAFFAKWSPRLVYIGLLVMVLSDILIDVILFGTTSQHEVWPSVADIMWRATQTAIGLLALLVMSTHRARRGIVLLLMLDLSVDVIMQLAHVETTYDSWTLIRDALWVWAIFVLAAGSPPKEKSGVPAYPSIERIP